MLRLAHLYVSTGVLVSVYYVPEMHACWLSRYSPPLCTRAIWDGRRQVYNGFSRRHGIGGTTDMRQTTEQTPSRNRSRAGEAVPTAGQQMPPHALHRFTSGSSDTVTICLPHL
jgi:hypothetical protein